MTGTQCQEDTQDGLDPPRAVKASCEEGLRKAEVGGVGPKRVSRVNSVCKGSEAGGSGFLPGIFIEQIARTVGWGQVWVAWLVCS